MSNWLPANNRDLVMPDCSLPNCGVHISLAEAKNGNRIAKIRILDENKNITWRQISVGPHISKKELIQKAVAKGREYCPKGWKIARQRFFDELF